MLCHHVFIKNFLGADSSSLKIIGLPTVVRNTDPARLIESRSGSQTYEQ